jgi:hypothetical protein
MAKTETDRPVTENVAVSPKRGSTPRQVEWLAVLNVLDLDDGCITFV